MADRRSTKQVAALAVAAAFALGGCGASTGAAAGVAAQVGRDAVTVDFVQDRVAMIIDFNKGQTPTDEQIGSLQRSVIEQSIFVTLIDQLAEDEGITVSEAEMDKAIAEERDRSAQQGQPAPPLALLRESARLQVIYGKLQIAFIGGPPQDEQQNAKFVGIFETKMSALAEQLKVEVNPRYGSWDYQAKFLGTQGGTIKAGAGALVAVEPPATQPQQPQLPQGQ